MKFEDLLPRPIEEMTDEEIQSVIKKMTDKQLKSFETAQKKARGKKKRTPTAKQKKQEDEFFKLLNAGSRK
jgi:hypothetical protein